MVFFNELFQTVRLSKWYLHFDTASLKSLSPRPLQEERGSKMRDTPMGGVNRG